MRVGSPSTAKSLYAGTFTTFLTHKCYRCPDCAAERRTLNAER
jgi:hypothetical protein